MLINLQIKDYLLISKMDIDFYSGLTVITGETGSGKSITVDALMLIFGAKASTEIIRKEQSQASFTATFQIDSLQIIDWLREKEFLDDQEQNTVICRRVVDRNGRSKSFINSIPVNLSVLKDLGEMLLDIHTQHASIALLKVDNQRRLLDEFAGVSQDVSALGNIYREISLLRQKINKAQQSSQDLLIRQEILEEKITDIKELALQENEWEELQIRQKQLANAGFLLQELDFVTNLLVAEQGSIADISGTINVRLSKISDYLSNNEQIMALISGIEAGISELEHELQVIANKIEQDPDQLAIIDNRIDEIYTLSRKYRIRPEELPHYLAEWQNELANMASDNNLEQLQHALEQSREQYQLLATKISEIRKSAATDLSARVTQLLHKLAINGEFVIELRPSSAWSSYGIDEVQYQVCFNQGLPLQSLNKVASGGELSRVALALYVVLSVNNPPELIVFDEIDVGIGGGVAEIVGTLLRELGKSKQVICITHQPQTACCGNNHLRVSKSIKDKVTSSRVEYVSENERIMEIARMVGGINITETTLNHAKEMLKI